MFPYRELKLMWNLNEEIIECSSDVELASKINFDLIKKNVIQFIVKGKGLKAQEMTDSESETSMENAPIPKKSGRFESLKDSSPSQGTRAKAKK